MIDDLAVPAAAGARDALAVLLAETGVVGGVDRALRHWLAGAVAALAVVSGQGESDAAGMWSS
jgi:hypothetical protein